MDREYSIPIEPQYYEKLEVESREEHRDKSEIVNDLLRRHFFRQTFEKLQREIEPLARAAGWNSEEDVFREVS
jgi:hypothetical protein